jgi:endonuclease/exonuclease/phosphatase family metal-dependent hydrolase
VRETSPDAVPLLKQFTVASYNVHRCIGMDRRHDPDRVAVVVQELAADVIALQEVEALPRTEAGLDQIEYLAKATRFHAVPGPTLIDHRGEYGNAVLTRYPVLAVRRHDLSVSGREPRGAIDVDLDLEGSPVRVIATHLGLRPFERRSQVVQLLRLLVGDRDRPLILLGDFNEWRRRGPLLRAIEAHLGKPVAVRTFPASRPLFALDRVWVQPREALAWVRVHVSPLARVASDHLPVRAAIELRARA